MLTVNLAAGVTFAAVSTVGAGPTFAMGPTFAAGLLPLLPLPVPLPHVVAALVGEAVDFRRPSELLLPLASLITVFK